VLLNKEQIITKAYAKGIAKLKFNWSSNLKQVEARYKNYSILIIIDYRREPPSHMNPTHRPAAGSIGERFGRLVVIAVVGRNRHRQAQVECQCDCGKRCIVLLHHLRRGEAGYPNTKSCGCLAVDMGRTLADRRKSRKRKDTRAMYKLQNCPLIAECEATVCSSCNLNLWFSPFTPGPVTDPTLLRAMEKMRASWVATPIDHSIKGSKVTLAPVWKKPRKKRVKKVQLEVCPWE
jgi:hypothetical protein